MKNVVIAILMVAGLALTGCGSGNHSGNVDGNWTAAFCFWYHFDRDW